MAGTALARRMIVKVGRAGVIIPSVDNRVRCISSSTSANREGIGSPISYQKVAAASRFLSSQAAAGGGVKGKKLEVLPIVDIGPLLDPTSSSRAKEKVAQELHKACVEVGFLYVINHGLSTSLTHKALDLAKQFFELPQDIKNEISIFNTTKKLQATGGEGISCRGYQKVGENVTKYARDLHEAIDMYREGEDHRTGHLAGFGGKNPWLPDKYVPGFQQMFEHEYVEAMLGLGNNIMHGFALGFNLPPDYFTPYYNRSFWCMRIIRYPPLVSMEERENLSKGFGCGEHCDYGCLTLLNMDSSTEALQALTVEGDWIYADPIPGALLVNIGDMLSRWSNGKFRSTPHRVLPAVGQPRTSIPFFFEPNLDTLVEPLPSCDQYAKALGRTFEPVLFADHLRGKVTNNFSFLSDESSSQAA